ncbi:MAG: hypothetical protein AAF493_26145 [Pseudomonadota bacterium]
MHTCALTDMGVVIIDGADSRRFLQAQFTNDIDSLTAERAQLSAWCTPNGRVQYLFLLIAMGDAIYALMPKHQLDEFIESLRRYVMRSKVRLETDSGRFTLHGLVGSHDQSTGPFIGWPEASWDARQSSSGSALVRLSDTCSIALIDANDSVTPEWCQTFTACAEPLWHEHRLRSSQPNFERAMTGKYIPQMLNLDLVEGLSFSKGCYPGQEIVARTQYLGRLKRRLFVGVGKSDTAPAPGTAVAGADGANIGELLDCAVVEGELTVQAVLSLEGIAATPSNTTVYCDEHAIDIIGPFETGEDAAATV